MLEKKLVTLGCAVGILACGACFLPPLPEHRPPPPPPPVLLDLKGIHRIRLEVSNTSESHHLDAEALAGWIEFRIDSDARRAGVKAFSQKNRASADADGVLQVNIHSETVEPQQGGSSVAGESWTFQIRLSAKLTKEDGEVVWSEPDGDYQFSQQHAATDAVDIFNYPEVRNWLTVGIGRQLVWRMLNGQSGPGWRVDPAGAPE
jgi:hypothetical protein